MLFDLDNSYNKEIGEHPDDGYAFIYISALRYGNDEYGKALSAINQALKKLPKKDKEYTALAYYRARETLTAMP